VSEKEKIIKESLMNESEDAYFKASPQIDCIDRRRVFEAGFSRGYDCNSHQQLIDALQNVKKVLESDDPAIIDTVWVSGDQPETLLDHVVVAREATSATQEMFDDPREIEMVSNDDACINLYMLGQRGVTRIEVYKESGPMSYLPYIAIWKGDFLYERLPAIGLRITYRVKP